jgi:NAD(P)-dependent dehydrogenase (short-subunit alcohol dehydrogenase family)
MKDLNDKVAVITGGASGMGLAFAHRFAAAGMKVAIGDIEEPALEAAVAELVASGAEVFGSRCDVTDIDSFRRFAADAEEAFGPAHVVCLNAGVAGSGEMVDLTLSDWNWVLGVNLWGVVHGLDIYLKGLVARNEGHVVVTASVAGHTSFPGIGPYNASKHAVSAIAETLHNELVVAGSDVGVTSLCPGFVATGIFDSGRNRPEHLLDALAELPSEEQLERRQMIQEWMAQNAKDPTEVADLIHDAVLEQTFWVFTDPDHIESIERRHEEIRGRRNPSQEQSIGLSLMD